MNNYLNKDQLSEYIKISKPTIDRMVKEGKMNSIKIGRRVLFDVKDIDKFINKHKRMVENV